MSPQSHTIAAGLHFLVTKAGNVYAFHTPFYGSTAGHTLPALVVGIAAAR